MEVLSPSLSAILILRAKKPKSPATDSPKNINPLQARGGRLLSDDAKERRAGTSKLELYSIGCVHDEVTCVFDFHQFGRATEDEKC